MGVFFKSKVKNRSITKIFCYIKSLFYLIMLCGFFYYLITIYLVSLCLIANHKMTNKIPKHDKLIKDIGIQVQYYRKIKGFTQEELADKINKTVDTISNIERGIFGVKVETLFDISVALEIEIKDLFVTVKHKFQNNKAKKINEIINKISKQELDAVLTIDKVVSEICRLKYI
jgi:transcriptional regulator with XRE-family HTH domain